MKTRFAIDDDIRAEIARRFRDRNVPGYWGLNARAWIRFHIKAIRQGKSYGFRSY